MALTYTNAVALLARGRNGQKKLGNNTVLHRIDDNTLAVRLHRTDVVKLHSDGTYTLDSGGWRTVTTKARINEYSPARLYQSNNIWYVGDAVYHDGIKVDASGKPIGETEAPAVVQRKKRKLDKQVREYIVGFAADAVEKGGLTQPGNGDCWACLFKAQSQNGEQGRLFSKGTDVHADQPMGFDHLFQHFSEKYYVPSLLWKAIQAHGYANPAVIWHHLDSQVKAGRTEGVIRELAQYFRKLKPELLKLAA